MRITIQQMSILNFKGIRDLTINFNEESTSIMGANATGKSTVFDAFTWLLFGKDSSDRKDFNIKTIDPMTSLAIERIPHEVNAILLVDGNELKLRKCYNEKWTKKRGLAIEEFTGHEVTQFINDVPCGAREYQKEIDAIVPEHIFKLITNPLYFTAQKKDVQRQTLFTMAGTLTDEEIASGNSDFVELMAQLTGKTLEGYKKEISAKKKKIKDELAGIPSRVDERKRSMPEVENWVELESELSSKRKMIADIDSKLLDSSKLLADANKKRQELMTALNSLKNEKLELGFTIKENELASHRRKEAKKNELTQGISDLQNQVTRLNSSISSCRQELNHLLSERETLINEWKKINALQLEVNEDDFKCPTCNRTFEVTDIEEKQAEMTTTFNKCKVRQLEENKRKGLALKAKIESLQSSIEKNQNDINEINTTIATLQQSPELSEVLVAPDCTPIIEADARYIDLTNRITDLENQLEQKVELPDNDELNEGKSTLSESISELNKRLAKKEAIDANNRRIAELENEQRTMSQELATLEGIEFTIAEFSKARIEAVEDKINQLFEIVSFRMYETQINGGEVETCEAMVDGVPFSDLNTAMKINAGLDIINTICRYNDVNAPIFVDNAESVNVLFKTNSQMVKLTVSDDDALTVIL